MARSPRSEGEEALLESLREGILKRRRAPMFDEECDALLALVRVSL